MDEVLNSVPCGYLSFADDGKILAANQTLLDMLERSDRKLEGQHVESIFTVASRIFYQTHFLPLLTVKGRAEEIYLTLRSGTGSDLPVLVNAARVDRLGRLSNDCIVVPMRRRSLFEDEILRAKKDLEEANQAKDQVNAELELTRLALEKKQRELQDRNCELEALKERLEGQVEERTTELSEALEDLESFSYAIAHDLRGPLRAIVSTSEILRAETSAILAEEQLSLLDRQSFNGRKLSALVDDLLRFARLGRQGILREPVNVSELAMNIIAGISPAHGSKKPSFNVQGGLRVRGDPALIRILLENLIQNAVKYSPEGGTVRIGSKSVGETSAFFVQDTGIGFDMEFAEKIFQPFERLHSDSRFEGSGIGLATVKRIAERHGGAVWATSLPGQGSTFYFTLGAAGRL
jgi:hypothetical protein